MLIKLKGNGKRSGKRRLERKYFILVNELYLKNRLVNFSFIKLISINQ